MSNLYLTMMIWVLFLPIFEAHLFLKKEPKPPGALKLQITKRGLDYAKTHPNQTTSGEGLEGFFCKRQGSQTGHPKCSDCVHWQLGVKTFIWTNIVLRSLLVFLGLDVDDGGRPLVRLLSCLADVLDFEVCVGVEKSIDQFSNNLRNTKFWVQIDPIAGFNYSLVSKPQIAEDRCNLDFKGEFFLMGGHQRSPLVPSPLVLPKRSSSMVVIGISDVLVNSAAFVYFSGNMLQVKYTDKTLKRQFPEMPMELHLAAQKEPKLHFHPGGLDAIVLGRAEAFVVLPNSSLVHVFTLNVDCNFTGQIFLEGVHSGHSFAKVGGSVALKGFLILGYFSPFLVQLSPLETLLKIAGQVALSVHNLKLRAGKLLPAFYGASLMGPEVSVHEVSTWARGRWAPWASSPPATPFSQYF
ncbi:BPI fold-containing family C protein [Ophiophagus hannah]|uniref:Bactericidal permeability-increasing protein n=1 Tax=Ophiophagus hannah TaxID=8665 RepID=V8NAK5_OPHHA|nr:BPI fold-containing family C protein [Ophiophagus hannah]